MKRLPFDLKIARKISECGDMETWEVTPPYNNLSKLTFQVGDGIIHDTMIVRLNDFNLPVGIIKSFHGLRPWEVLNNLGYSCPGHALYI